MHEPLGVELSTVTEAGPATGVAAPRRLRRAFLVGTGILAVVTIGLALAAGALYAWDAGYEGRILPGVSVGTTPLAGLDRARAASVIDAALPFGSGTLVLRTADGDVSIPYADVGRRADADALTDEAIEIGRSGGVLQRAIGEVRLALTGQVVAPAVVLDEDALSNRVHDAVEGLNRAATDATIRMTEAGEIVITRSRTGRTADPTSVAAAAIEALRRTDAPPEVVIPVATTVVQPTITDAAVLDARDAATAMASDLAVVFKDRTWTIRATRIRTWLRFDTAPDGSISTVIDETRIPAVFAKAIARAVRKDPSSAQFLVSRSGKTVGVVASSTGRKLDAAATTRAVVAALNVRAAGGTPDPVKIRTAVVLPKLGTDEAARKAPVMSLLGSWRTWFPISDRNFNGANIWVPAKLINGTVLAPGQTFDWWDAIWPVTPARGFGPGGIIRVDHTEPTGALGGGMCSSSTTLFNAAMRAGLTMGARSNHRYYINRYPLGLDATVSIIRGARQTMTFRNDTRHPIFIRGIRTRAGRIGWVKYEIWGIPDGRSVSISKPRVSNVRTATTKQVLVDTLPKGTREQIEYPSDGMDVSVTRVVRTAGGRVIHRDTWVSHYVLWNGIVEVGR